MIDNVTQVNNILLYFLRYVDLVEPTDVARVDAGNYRYFSFLIIFKYILPNSRRINI